MALDANITNVDAAGNVKTTLTTDVAFAGYVMLAGELAEETDPTGRIVQDLRASAQGRLSVGQPIMLLNEIFNYTTLNSAIFTAPVTTQTVTVASGTLNLNASAITTLSTVSRVSTYATYPVFSDLATYCTFDALLTQVPQTNNTVELGFGVATASAAPTDGVFFRYDSTGTLKAVLNNNSTEFTSAALTAPSAGVMHRYKIIAENDRVLFYIDGACQAIISSPTNLGMPMYSSSQPWFARVYNGAVAPTLAQTVKVGYLYVGMQDAAGLGKDNAVIAASRGCSASQGQSGHTMGSTALYTNSLAAGAGAAMTNTTAALGVGLGGQFSALPTLAVGTDGILCSYLNPIPTSAIAGKTLYITGVRIQGVVSTVLAGGPVVYAYSLAYGHNALSLATAESSTTKAPRRVPIGIETYGAAAAAGVLGSQGIYMPFASKIAVQPGEYVAITAKNLGVVTTTGVITVLVSFDGYFE